MAAALLRTFEGHRHRNLGQRGRSDRYGRHYRVPRRTSNGWRAQLSFGPTRRPGEGIPARTIRPRGNEVWPDESKCLCRWYMPSSPPERGSSRCPKGNAAGKPTHLHYAIMSLVPYPWQASNGPHGWRKMRYMDPTPLLNAATKPREVSYLPPRPASLRSSRWSKRPGS